MKINGTSTSFDADKKRFYVPGQYLEGKCPKCNADYEHGFGDNYLSYPTANRPFDFVCRCEDESCEHEWHVELRLNINVEVVDTTTSIVDAVQIT